LGAEYTGQPASRLRFEDILYEKKDGIARVTLNRPEVYNAYSAQTLREMTQAFRDAAWDDSVAVVVLTGAGEKAFCAGGDAKEFSDEFLRRPRNYWKWQGLLLEALELFRHVGKPTIARINGTVAGGGNDWNLAADLAIAAEHARFMQVGTRVGLVDALGSSQWLPLVVGDRRAREMLLTCDEITAEQALSWGLVNQVVPFRQLDRAVNALAKKLIQKFPECTRYTKQQLNFWKDLAWSLTAGHARDWLAIHSHPGSLMRACRPLSKSGPPTTAASGNARRQASPASFSGARPPAPARIVAPRESRKDLTIAGNAGVR
jgi:enoyl-CoA hydratase/carnithine racemase